MVSHVLGGEVRAVVVVEVILLLGRVAEVGRWEVVLRLEEDEEEEEGRGGCAGAGAAAATPAAAAEVV